MRAILKLEAIGDDYFAYARFGKRELPQYERHKYQLTKRSLRPWVARISGSDDHYVYAREFLEGTKDYTHATSTGSRGVFIYYALKPGIYEVNDRISWHRARRYFICVEGENITEIEEAEVIAWLANTT